MRPRAARGGGVSLMGEVGLGRVSGRGLERPRPRQAGSRLRNLAGLFPPRCQVRPPARPGSSPWASPPPAPHPPQALVPRLPPCPCPYPESRSGRRRESRGGTGATTRRAKRAEGLRGQRAAGARTAGPQARLPRRALPAEKTAVRPLRSHPPQPRPWPIRLALSDSRSRLRLSLIGRRGSGGSSSRRGAGLQRAVDKAGSAESLRGSSSSWDPARRWDPALGA